MSQANHPVTKPSGRKNTPESAARKHRTIITGSAGRANTVAMGDTNETSPK